MKAGVKAESEIESELAGRIKIDLEHFNGVLPERHAIAWHAYLAGLSEWGVISFPSHGRLVELLPQISQPNPVSEILVGREE